jgi:hypothetical protein
LDVRKHLCRFANNINTMKVQKREKKFNGYEYPILMHNPSEMLGSIYYVILAISEDELNIEGFILYTNGSSDKYTIGYKSSLFSKVKFEPYEGELILSNN